MNGVTARSTARSIFAGSLVQVCIALPLVATGSVQIMRGAAVDLIGVPLGAAAGLGLFELLAGTATPPRRVGGTNAVLKLAALLAAVSIAEEILWRGFAFESLRTTTGPVVALSATSIGFAAAHASTQGWSGVRSHLVTGLAMGLAVLLTGSLLSAIATHLSYNLLFLRTVQARRSPIR